MRLPHLAVVLAALTLAPVLQAQNLNPIACQSGSAGGYGCDSVDLAAVVPTGVDGPLRTSSTNDVWGWTDPQDGREYALVGTRSGTVFVDVTTPEDPLVLGKLLTETGNSTWRDIKVYADHAFVVSEASGHGMQVFDLTRLRGLTPDALRDFASDVTYFGTGGNTFGGAHNIVMNEDTGFAYVVGANDCAGGLHMVDVRDPAAPAFAGCFSADGYTHDAQCVTYDGTDEDYQGREICAAYNEDHVAFVDVTDKASPVLISRGYYPNPGYTHQGWFTEDKRYVVVNDETDASSPGTRTLILDVADLDAPEFAFAYSGDVPTRDHNLYVRGQYAYLSNYEGGLRIVDLAGIADGVLTEVAFFDTFPQGQSANGWGGQWSNYPFFESGTVIATDQDNGLFVLQPGLLTTDAEPPVPAGTPDAFTLSVPVPNPFRTGTALRLSVARTQAVVAEVLDAAGRRVAVLHDGPAVAGSPLTLHLDAARTQLPAGLYLVRVVGEDFTATRRASLVR